MQLLQPIKYLLHEANLNTIKNKNRNIDIVKICKE